MTGYLAELPGVGDKEPAVLRRAELLVRMVIGEQWLYRPDDPDRDVEIMYNVLHIAVQEMGLAKAEIVGLVIEAEGLLGAADLDSVDMAVLPMLPMRDAPMTVVGVTRPILRQRIDPARHSPGGRKVGRTAHGLRRPRSDANGPRTLVGQLMRARVLRQPQAQAEWARRVGEAGWVNMEECTDVLFEMAVARRFVPGADLGDIDGLVATMVEYYENERLRIPRWRPRCLFGVSSGRSYRSAIFTGRRRWCSSRPSMLPLSMTCATRQARSTNFSSR